MISCKWRRLIKGYQTDDDDSEYSDVVLKAKFLWPWLSLGLPRDLH